MGTYTVSIRLVGKKEVCIYDLYSNDQILVKSIGLKAMEKLKEALDNKERLSFAPKRRGKDKCYEVLLNGYKVVNSIRKCEKDRLSVIIDSWG